MGGSNSLEGTLCQFAGSETYLLQCWARSSNFQPRTWMVSLKFSDWAICYQPLSASFSQFQPLSATLQPAWATFDPFSHFVRATFAQMCEAGAAALCEVPKRYSAAAKTWISFQSRKCNRLFWAKGCRSSTKWHCCKSSIGCKCCRSSTSDTVAEVAMVAKVA